MSESRRAATSGILLAVGALSAAAIGYELLLMRLFALVHWHHMVGVAIALALLGYGASGTFVTLLSERLRAHFHAAFVLNAVAFAISMPLCVTVAQTVTFDPQSVTWQLRPIALLAASFLILALPFFAAANCIALSLLHYRHQIPRIYGVDLIGAGAGAILLTAALAWLHPTQALVALALVGSIAALLGADGRRRYRQWVMALSLLFGLAWATIGPIEIGPAAYKDLARTLTVIGAEDVLERSGISGTVNVVDNRQVRFREAPGLSLSSMVQVPRQLAVFVDGDAAGAIDRIDSGDIGEGYLGQLLSALPYRLREDARVVVLNAGVGRGVAQAVALGAREVVAVESNPLLVSLPCETFINADPRRCATDRVRWRIGSARAFATTAETPFDIVFLNAHGDAAGLDALQVDFDLSVEALQQYLGQLAPNGVLAIEGPSQAPPRWSIRLLATARAALAATGETIPAARLALLRGWQRYLLLVFEQPVNPATVSRLRDQAAQGGYDIAWLPGVTADEVNRFQQLARPLFFEAARAVLERGHEDGLKTLGITADPATDDRPFPYRFSAGSALLERLAAPGTPVDAGLLIAMALLALAVLASVLLIVAPLAVLRRKPRGDGQLGHTPSPRWAVAGYFGLIGIAFLAVEIGWILALELFLDEPLYAAALVLAGFLVFAGIGSLVAQRLPVSREGLALGLSAAAIVAGGSVYLLWLNDWLAAMASLPFSSKATVSILLLAPLAFAMGVPFPVGLRAFGRRTPSLVPWAWGINGCASVISAVGSPLLALGIGYDGLLGVAVFAYVAAAVLLNRHLRRTEAPRSSPITG